MTSLVSIRIGNWNNALKHTVACVVALALLSLPSLAKEKNPADFPETLVVTEGQTQSYVAGAAHDSTCDNPQGSFMKGFCSSYGHHSTVHYREYSETVGIIGNMQYTLEGKGFLQPATYRARFTKDGVEVLSNTDKDKVYKFRVVRMAKLPDPQPAVTQVAATECSGMTEDQARREAVQWVATHKEYKQTPENAQKIAVFMEEHGLCPSQKNFDLAYEVLKPTLQ